MNTNSRIVFIPFDGQRFRERRQLWPRLHYRAQKICTIFLFVQIVLLLMTAHSLRPSEATSPKNKDRKTRPRPLIAPPPPVDMCDRDQPASCGPEGVCTRALVNAGPSLGRSVPNLQDRSRTMVSILTGARCQCPDGWTGVRCMRPCQDIYEACTQWQDEGRCVWTRPILPFFLDNCPRACGACRTIITAAGGPAAGDAGHINSMAARRPRPIKLAAPLPPVLEPLAWLVGRWEARSSRSNRFPVPLSNSGGEDGSYMEVLDIRPSPVAAFDRPALNVSIRAWATKTAAWSLPEPDQHIEFGFITMKPAHEETGFLFGGTGGRSSGSNGGMNAQNASSSFSLPENSNEGDDDDGDDQNLPFVAPLEGGATAADGAGFGAAVETDFPISRDVDTTSNNRRPGSISVMAGGDLVAIALVSNTGLTTIEEGVLVISPLPSSSSSSSPPSGLNNGSQKTNPAEIKRKIRLRQTYRRGLGVQVEPQSLGATFQRRVQRQFRLIGNNVLEERVVMFDFDLGRNGSPSKASTKNVVHFTKRFRRVFDYLSDFV